jgi:hypothetical protein
VETQFDTVEELHSYLNNPENGCIAREEAQDFKSEAKLVPPVEGDPKTHCPVQLRINRRDGQSVLDFKASGDQERMEREGYLSFGVREDVYLQSGDRTISPVFHHYERNYGLKPSVDILFEFPVKNIKEDVTFCYRDEIFGQGLIRIPFDKELFKKCYVAKK